MQPLSFFSSKTVNQNSSKTLLTSSPLKRSRSDSDLLKNDTLKSKSHPLKRSKSYSDVLKTNILPSEDLMVKQILENIFENYPDDAKTIKQAINDKTESVLPLSKIPEIPSELKEYLEHITTIKLENFTGEIFTNNFKNIETVNVNECPNLTKLDVAEAKEIYISDCTALQDINAPEALYINAQKSIALKVINAPKAEKIKACNTALIKLDAPEAIKIDVSGAINLTELNVPKAQKIKASDTALTKLDAPEAKDVLIKNAKNLYTMNLPKVEYLDANKCTELTSINTPVVTKLLVSHCIKLTDINTPMLYHGNFSNCQNLKDIVLPQASYVNISNCQNLEKIELPLATQIEGFSVVKAYPNLKSFLAPHVQNMMYISDAPQLTEVNFSHAKSINIKNCPALKDIDVLNVSDNVKVSDCENLKEINISEAENVDVSNCINLSKLNAARSPFININSCRALEDIDINPNSLSALSIDTQVVREKIINFLEKTPILSTLNVGGTLVWNQIPQHIRDNPDIYIDIRPFFLRDQNIDAAQSTHNTTIHFSSSLCAAILQNKLSHSEIGDANIDLSLEGLRKYIHELPTQNPDILNGVPNDAFINSVAQRCIYNIPHANTQDRLSKVDVRTFLELFWKASHDDSLRLENITKQDALNVLIQALYEIQRGGNINNSNNYDNSHTNDETICYGGTFNKIYEKACGIFKNIDFRFITKKTIKMNFFASFRDIENNLQGEIGFYTQLTHKVKEKIKDINDALDKNDCLKVDDPKILSIMSDSVSEILQLSSLETFKIDIDKDLKDVPDTLKNGFKDKINDINKEINFWKPSSDVNSDFMADIIGYFRNSPLSIYKTTNFITEIGQSSGTKHDEQ